MKTFELGETGRAALLNAEGELLIRSDETSLAALQSQESASLLQDEKELRVHEIQRDNHTFLVSTRWLPELQRYLMIEVSKEEYLSSIRERFFASTGFAAC